jgi:hypothetical protein
LADLLIEPLDLDAEMVRVVGSIRWIDMRLPLSQISFHPKFEASSIHCTSFYEPWDSTMTLSSEEKAGEYLNLNQNSSRSVKQTSGF